jgi:hypothetical protein
MIAASGDMLFVEMLSQPGHLDVNAFFSREVFPHLPGCHYLLEEELYRAMGRRYGTSDNLTVSFFPKQLCTKGGWLSSRIALERKACYILDYLKSKDLGSVCLLSYDTLAMACHAHSFHRYRVTLMNHDNIARYSTTRLRRRILARMAPFHHLVYGSAKGTVAYSPMLSSLGISRIITMEHHIDSSWRQPGRRSYDPTTVRIYAPSNGNDNTKIIELLKALPHGPITVRAKVSKATWLSHRNRFDQSLFTGYITDTAYGEAMNSSDFILLPYPDDYRYRTSGILFDAIACSRPVITDNAFLYEQFLEPEGLGILVPDLQRLGETISRIDCQWYARMVAALETKNAAWSATQCGKDLSRQLQEIMGG